MLPTNVIPALNNFLASLRNADFLRKCFLIDSRLNAAEEQVRAESLRDEYRQGLRCA